MDAKHLWLMMMSVLEMFVGMRGKGEKKQIEKEPNCYTPNFGEFCSEFPLIFPIFFFQISSKIIFGQSTGKEHC